MLTGESVADFGLLVATAGGSVRGARTAFKPRQIKTTLRRMRHLPIPEQGATRGWC
jgi:hypothetical protein